MTIVTINEHDQDIINQAKAIIAKYMHTGKKLCSPNDVKDYLILNLGLLDYEEFCVLYLNNQNQVIVFEKLFRGTINETSVYPREIAKQVICYNAISVILVHNHPSGEALPSKEDVKLTQQIERVLSLIDVKVLDHFIVAKQKIVSMKELGII